MREVFARVDPAGLVFLELSPLLGTNPGSSPVRSPTFLRPHSDGAEFERQCSLRWAKKTCLDTRADDT